MKVVLSVAGRFHAFNLARGLARRSYLERLITSYPKYVVKKYGIPRDRISSILIKEVLQRGWNALPPFLKDTWNPQFAITEIYDRLAAHKIVPSDIFVGWANQSLFTMRKAKKMGAITILERGSSHILYQKEILEEEYRRWNIPFKKSQLPHPKIIERELEEYGEADYISVPSLFVKKTFLEKKVPETKLIHVPYGVDLANFHQIPKTDGIFRVIFVGGISLRKGTPYLLQSFAELNLQNAELVLIGSLAEEMKPFLKRYEGKFIWLGHIPQSELYKYYSQGSVFVMPSIEEGLAMVQAQAMACGLPVICTTNTGGEDIIRDGIEGFVIPIRDVESLKEKIVYFYEHPEIQKKMGVAARERVTGGFTWDDYGKRMIAKYEQILSS